MKIESLTLALALLLAGCGQDKHNAWLGYAEGDNAFGSAPLAGWVTSVSVKRGDLVMIEAMGGGFTWASALIRW